MEQMKTYKTTVLILFILSSLHSHAQIIKGVVLDAITNEPIESASVYFDNTTIGTSTNDKGQFEIEQKEGVTSGLVISFLGYEKVVIDSYNSKEFYKILLKPAIDTLDEVVITTSDGMSRALKLEHFKEQFLGFSKLSKSCTILNEEDIILKYKKDVKELTASAKSPIVIQNEGLKYLIYFDLHSFVIKYSFVDIEDDHFHIKEVAYLGTTFYESFANSNDKKIFKNRDRAYQGSVLHFMRALSQNKIEAEGFEIFSSGFKVNPSNYIFLKETEDSEYVNVRLLKPVSILYNRKQQSEVQPRVKEFLIDSYGNYAPLSIVFSGDMGNQRVGDLLPFDYKLLGEE